MCSLAVVVRRDRVDISVLTTYTHYSHIPAVLMVVVVLAFCSFAKNLSGSFDESFTACAFFFFLSGDHFEGSNATF